MQIRSLYGGLPVDCGANGSTVTNSGPQTVYYRDEFPCDATTNDGSIASGASASLTGTKYLFVTTDSTAVVQLTPATAAATTAFVTAAIAALDARYALIGATPSGTPGSGSKLVSVAGTRVKLAASTTPVKSVVVTAGTGNTGIVVIGASTVVAASGTRVGTPLSAGDSYTVSYTIDLTDWYIDATVGGEGVTMSWVV